MAKNGNFKVLVVQNGWNSQEPRWNGLREIPAEVSGPIPPLFHAVPTVLDHRNLEIAIFGHFGPILAILGAPGSNLGAPCCTKLVQKLRHGPPLTCSTFLPCLSNRFGPPGLETAIFGHYSPIWAPLGHIWGQPAAPNWSKNIGLDLP